MNFAEEIFDPGFDLTGLHLVAASAGTGKTYNMQNVYARLVAERGLRVSQIQVMTFTEAATKELRSRIRKVLVDYDRFLRGEEPDGAERLEKLLACAEANVANEENAADGAWRKVVQARLGLALLEFDQALISTIHGFCSRVLARYAFETNAPFSAEIEDTKDADLAGRVNDWWRAHGHEAPEGAKRDTLDAYVKSLSAKSGWKLASSDDPDSADAGLLEVAGKIVREYENARASRERQTYDDLQRSVRDALQDPSRGPRLARLMREELKAALVDEFQDTDSIQYDIFKAVFLSEEAMRQTSLFFVGDPKQAIYSFRGGDIYVYANAVADQALDGRKYRLDVNFRSTSRLIDAVNALFRDGKDDSGNAVYTFGSDAIDYPSGVLSCGAKPALKMADGADDPAPFRFVAAQGKKVADREAVLAAEVVDVLEEQKANGLRPGGVAILVSSHAKAESIRDLLRQKNVPCALQRSGSVFAGAAVREFRVVLQAMALSGGIGQVRAALATPFFGFPPAELANEESAALADMVVRFREWNAIWLSRGFNAAFAAMASVSGFRLRFASMPDGERRLADVDQLLDLMLAAVRDVGPAPDALVDWLTERINRSEAEARTDEYERRLESERDAVNIMTTFASKGLEFDVVFVSLLSDSPSQKPPYAYHDGPENELFFSVTAAASESSRDEAIEEEVRKLYVAMTRATKRTVVVFSDPSDKDGKRDSTPKPRGVALERLIANARRNGAGEGDANSPIRWTTRGCDIASVPSYALVSEPPSALVPARTPPVYSREPLSGSYSSLSPTEGERDDGEGADVDAATGAATGAASAPPPSDGERAEEEADGEGTDRIFLLPGGAKIGVCWHEILEKIPFDADDGEIAERVEASLALNGLLPADRSERTETVSAVSEMVAKTLSWPMASPDGKPFTLAEIPWEDRISEWEFRFSSRDAVATTAKLAGIISDAWRGNAAKAPFLSAMSAWDKKIPHGFLKGFMDLVFRKDGFYYVVDWKSNLVGGSAASFTEVGVAQEMAAHGYFFQYLLYAAVLHRHLADTLDGYSWERNFGGIRYCFLRGMAAGREAAVFADRPPEALLDRLAEALGLEGGR